MLDKWARWSTIGKPVYAVCHGHTANHRGHTANPLSCVSARQTPHQRMPRQRTIVVRIGRDARQCLSYVLYTAPRQSKATHDARPTTELSYGPDGQFVVRQTFAMHPTSCPTCQFVMRPSFAVRLYGLAHMIVWRGLPLCRVLWSFDRLVSVRAHRPVHRAPSLCRASRYFVVCPTMPWA
jgi:hypothetical protein